MFIVTEYAALNNKVLTAHLSPPLSRTGEIDTY